MPFVCNNALNNSYPELNFSDGCNLLLSATSWRNGIRKEVSDNLDNKSLMYFLKIFGQDERDVDDESEL
ncbi:MAG: hypothetical protein F6K22_14330 [Okeania sp. SIO2F4]|uniref:hypothetical protein n=1 Tax=Okeania sp. SIO2F4 TaxID=2607790 RepID=UPI0014296B87|nr:hypothetical protein [Okeania sp. SIO2F4]NES03918.1 hypothetical protein [Okeania sp. SIO2F4]